MLGIENETSAFVTTSPSLSFDENYTRERLQKSTNRLIGKSIQY